MKNKIMKKFMLSLSMLIAFSSSNFAFCANTAKKKEQQESSLNSANITAVTGLAFAMLFAAWGLIASYNQEVSQN